MSMVDRVALAIAYAQISAPNDTCALARAAIEAMRNPTKTMARHGSYEAETCVKDDPCGQAGKHVWNTMIDEALR